MSAPNEGIQTNTQSPSTMQTPAPPVTTPPPTTTTQQTLTPEQQEFMNILNDLILSAQELSYALAVVDQRVIESHPELKDLIDAARSVVKNVWRFHRFVKTKARGLRT